MTPGAWDDPTGAGLAARAVEVMKTGDAEDLVDVASLATEHRSALGSCLLECINVAVEWRNCVTGLADASHRALLLPETIEHLRAEGFAVEVETPRHQSRRFAHDRRVFCMVRRPAGARAAGGAR